MTDKEKQKNKQMNEVILTAVNLFNAQETLHPNSPSPPTAAERCDSTLSNVSNWGADICRICHCESEPDSPLISPCLCSGSLKYVHQMCLQQWIKSADTKSCELCKYVFVMKAKVKPFRKWQRLDMTAVERRKVFCSVTFHIIAVTCVIWSLYVLIDRTTEEIKAGILEWPFWTKLIVVAIGFTGGLVFMYVQCKMYMQLCRRWRAYNRVIYIENCPEGTKPAANDHTVDFLKKIAASPAAAAAGGGVGGATAAADQSVDIHVQESEIV